MVVAAEFEGVHIPDVRVPIPYRAEPIPELIPGEGTPSPGGEGFSTPPADPSAIHEVSKAVPADGEAGGGETDMPGADTEEAVKDEEEVAPPSESPVETPSPVMVIPSPVPSSASAPSPFPRPDKPSPTSPDEPTPTSPELETCLSEIEGIISSIEEPTDIITGSPEVKPIGLTSPELTTSDTSSYQSTPVIPAFVVDKVSVQSPEEPPKGDKPLISVTILRHEEVLFHTDIGGDIPDDLPTEIPDELPVDVEVPAVQVEVPAVEVPRDIVAEIPGEVIADIDREGTKMINIRPASAPEDAVEDDSSVLDKFFRRFSSFSIKSTDDVTVTPRDDVTPCVSIEMEQAPDASLPSSTPATISKSEDQVAAQRILEEEPLPHHPPDVGLPEILSPVSASKDPPELPPEKTESLFEKFVDAFSKDTPDSVPESANHWTATAVPEMDWSPEKVKTASLTPGVMCCGKGEITPPDGMDAPGGLEVPGSEKETERKGSIFDKFVDMFNKEETPPETEAAVETEVVPAETVDPEEPAGMKTPPVEPPPPLPPVPVEIPSTLPLDTPPPPPPPVEDPPMVPTQETNPPAEDIQPALMELHSEGSLYADDPGLAKSPFSAQPAVEAIEEFFSNILPSNKPSEAPSVDEPSEEVKIPTPVFVIKSHSPQGSEVGSIASSSAEQASETESSRSSPLITIFKRLGPSPTPEEAPVVTEPDIVVEESEMVIEESEPEPEKPSEFVNQIIGIFSMPKKPEEPIKTKPPSPAPAHAVFSMPENPEEAIRLPSPASELEVESPNTASSASPAPPAPPPPRDITPVSEPVEKVAEETEEAKPERIFVNHILGMFSKPKEGVEEVTPPPPPAAAEMEVTAMTSSPAPVTSPAPPESTTSREVKEESEKSGIGGLFGNVTLFGGKEEEERMALPIVAAEPTVVTAMDHTPGPEEGKNEGGMINELWSGMLKWDLLAEKQVAAQKKPRTIMRLQNSEEHEDIEAVSTVAEWIKSDVEKRRDRDNDPFIVCDISQVFERKHQWDNQFPGIIMFYHLDYFNCLAVRVLLNSLHCGFVCSKWEDIEHCLRVGVSPQKIVYQQPFKDKARLHTIVACGILIVCYNKADVKVVGDLALELGVKTSVLLQLDVSEEKLVQHPVLKGMLPGDVCSVVNEAQRSGVNIIGLSVDVSSGMTLEGCVVAKNVWRELETRCTPTLLHIGGSYSPVDPAQDSELMTKVLIDCFEDILYSQHVFVIGDLKGYLTESSLSLVCNVTHCKDFPSRATVHLVLNTEVDPELWDSQPYIVPLTMLEMYKKNIVRPSTQNRTIWDVTQRPPVMLPHSFPKLGEGDWIVFPEAGKQRCVVRRKVVCTGPHDKAVLNLLNGQQQDNVELENGV